MAIRSPLDARHRSLGATMTEFAGWTMPVRYGSEIAEHQAVRTGAGLFDLSHMGEIYVTGPGAADALDYALVSRIDAIEIGGAKYTMLCAADGGVLDDLVVYRTASDSFLVVANAANVKPAVRELRARCAGFDCKVTDASLTTALIAIQGPGSFDVVKAMIGSRASVDPTQMGYYTCAEVDIDGWIHARLARTGYTGEAGFEIFVSVADAEAVWDFALSAGAGEWLVPCGLAARDTLRLEAGMPLYGYELTRSTTPFQASLGRVVHLGDASNPRGNFVGKEALQAAHDRYRAAEESPAEAPADARVLVGLVGEGKRAARSGYEVLDENGEPVGSITSGAVSPTLDHPIAMALVHPRVSTAGTALTVDVRGRQLPMAVTPLPFYRRSQ